MANSVDVDMETSRCDNWCWRVLAMFYCVSGTGWHTQAHGLESLERSRCVEAHEASNGGDFAGYEQVDQ